MITASRASSHVTATIPSQRPVLAGRDATQADKTNGLATHTGGRHRGARGPGCRLRRAPSGRHGCPCAWALPSGPVLLFMFGKCIQGSSQKHLQSSYLVLLYKLTAPKTEGLMVTPGTWSSPATNAFPRAAWEPSFQGPSPVQLWPAASSGGPCGPRHLIPSLGMAAASGLVTHATHTRTPRRQLRTKNFGGRVQLREALLPPSPSLVADLQKDREDTPGPRYGQQGPGLLSLSQTAIRGQQAWACNASSLHFRANSLHTLSLSILSASVACRSHLSASLRK